MALLFGTKSGEKRRHVDSVDAAMAVHIVGQEHHRHDQEVIGSLCRLGDSGSPHESIEYCVDEKRVRREIANSNERRRMQSINAGFQSLRSLLPQSEGEKLSKAAILQQTTEYIYQLEQEKSRLVAQNCHLKRLVGPLKKDLLDPSIPMSPEHINEVTVGSTDLVLSDSEKPQPDKEKRKGVLTGEAYSRAVDRLRKEVNESRALLEAERKLRLKLEEQIHALEAQLHLQIDVPEVDASEITAHILGRKPLLQPKLEKEEAAMDEDSDLIAAARSATSQSSASGSSSNHHGVPSGAKWGNAKKTCLALPATTTSTASVITSGQQRRNVITSAAGLSRQSTTEPPASDASVGVGDSSAGDASAGVDPNQPVQFLTPQGTLMTSLPAHLVLDDRPNRYPSSSSSQRCEPGSLLEAAMMAEPKVEVELASRVPSPALSLTMTTGPGSPSSLPVLSFQLPPHLAHLSQLAASDGSSSPIAVLQHGGDVDGVTFVDIDGQLSSDSKSYLAATSRQNLETIVEAIRHLEGDHLFNDDASCSRNTQLVQVEIDSEAIGCSLVVTSAQNESGDESLNGQEGNLQLTISEDQEVGEMITVTSTEDSGIQQEPQETVHDTDSNGESTTKTNVIVVKQM